MQPVNVLPAFVSKDTDLKADLHNKESSGTSAESNKGTNFSSLVAQHRIEENKVISDKESTSLEKKPAATNGDVITDSGKSDTDELNHSQQGDADKSLDANKIANNTNNTNKNNFVDDRLDKAGDSNKDNLTNKASLAESEQFISLLYKSDQTLAPVADKTELSKDTLITNSEQSITTDGKVFDTKQNNSQAVERILLAESENSTLKNEHKLKVFSKDELAAPTQLASNNVLATQSSEQGLNAYQLSLQPTQDVVKNESITSQQLTNAQLTNEKLANAQLKSKVSEVATGVSLASKGQLTEKVDSGLYPLPVEPIGKGILTANELLNSDKELTTKGEVNLNKAAVSVKSEGDIDTQLATKKNNDSAITPTKIINNSAGTIPTNATNSNVEKLPLSKANVDKTITDRNSQAAVTIDNLPKEQLVATKEKQAVMTSAQLHALQQVQPQQKIPPVTSEQPVIESVSDKFIEPIFLAEENSIEQGVKKVSKGMDNIAMRTLSELQTQTMQATQVKQSNDAYVEHQVSEVLNHSAASDTAQIQKNNILLQQETVSIFRKDFADAVKEKVMITINQKLQRFDITLDPPEFGNMQVRVNLQGEQASVNFIVQNQQAKEALEQNMHKLRDMLSEQGVDVGGANVEQQNQQQNNDEQNLSSKNGNALMNESQKDEHNVEHTLSAQLFDSSATGVDYYA